MVKNYSIWTEGAIDRLCLQHQSLTAYVNQAELQTLVRLRSFRWWSTPSTLMRLFSWSLDPSQKSDQRWKSVILPILRNRWKAPLEAQTPVCDFWCIHKNNGPSFNCTSGFIIALSLILKTKKQLQISRVGIMGNSKTDLERKRRFMEHITVSMLDLVYVLSI